MALCTIYRVYQKKGNLEGISEEIYFVLKAQTILGPREFRIAQLSKLPHTRVDIPKFVPLFSPLQRGLSYCFVRSIGNKQIVCPRMSQYACY